MDTLLIIEDELLFGNELKRHFERQDWHVILARNLRDGEHLLLRSRIGPLVVLSDMSLPDGNGLDLLAEARRAGDTSEWVFLTGYGEAGDAERARQLGAIDFLQKPTEFDKLDLVIAAAVRSARSQRRVRDYTSSERARYSVDAFIGSSVAARRVREIVARVHSLPLSSVMIGGETGTGKGLIARVLHYSGACSQGPFIEVNCVALPRDMLESELFGHESGAFTGAKSAHRGLMEQANGGSLFLDEISEMDPALQAKLLTAIESRRLRRLGGEREIKVDIQVMAATNRDLRAAISEGRFRADLYHRLAVFEIALPPLRARRDDIPDLVMAFIAEFNIKANKSVRYVTSDVMAHLAAYDWPGNVRELRNVIERSVLLSSGDQLPAEWLLIDPASNAPLAPAVLRERGQWIHLPLDGSMALEGMDRHIIQTALELHDHNVTATARALGTTRETLRYRIQKYGLARE